MVIEAGSPIAGDEAVAIPGRWTSLIGSPRDWGYASEAEAALDGRRITFPRGKAYGGSSATNAMTFVRGHRADFDGWRDAGCAGWGFDDLLPLFTRSEANSRGRSAFHGADGPLAVSDTPDPHRAHAAFLDAASALGYQSRPDWDFNGAAQEGGAGYVQKNIRNGRRHDTASAFLTPAMARPNVRLVGGASAQRVLIERGRAIGVEYVANGRREVVRAAREVVLCAGVIGTPKLLMLSGLGPAAELRRYRIGVVADLPAVGAHLQDHVKISVRWRGRALLPASTATAALFVQSSVRRGTPSPDLQFYVGRGLAQEDPFATITIALQRPASRGRVALRSADAADPPLIEPRYLSEPADLTALVEGVALIREVGNTAAFRAVHEEETEPGAAVTTRPAVEAFIRRAVDTIYHPAGTCRMGTGDDAVLDPVLRVRGVDGLRVADASIMPAVVNAPTHAACVMIGEKCADLLRG